jgi:hypothetical protein
MFEPGQVLNDTLEPVEALATGIRLITTHDRRPLLRRHGARSRIRKQIDQDMRGVKLKQVVPSLFEHPLPFLARRPAQRLDRLDAERLYDRLHDVKLILRFPLS